ncbi:MAG: hypothetical protein A3H59_01125 [Candidatus Jacksonbacteria bacterium RIFCSPLOWO2_02_FULL_43_9]|nr:MAG: hypothetical protein UV70_C0002G0048 [Parcubacteria group bacterium GW2011_GWA2_43_13]OGY68803.1 MAG: hypothetical protein A3B94_01595 [Candidatus Jacksonbacteria bacterium RIFCSPHIGHO2_02_FULL_43_10]OGY70519.1 MAG: hypothetical protein A2986_02230 [Candidatus Jacksonbacteria bacterium RIFCSPLOWO2_01_FULL_44_13]OGY74242.1 MAG: hypothetical protein A3H59_01125 [Candidatus Jacksonbacteria bacterium RIFCSPLOWO2_02_FULL_43_9]HAZ16284.1 hypothetical protein [Candidatus Jacksonbacteria bacter
MPVRVCVRGRTLVFPDPPASSLVVEDDDIGDDDVGDNDVGDDIVTFEEFVRTHLGKDWVERYPEGTEIVFN